MDIKTLAVKSLRQNIEPITKEFIKTAKKAAPNFEPPSKQDIEVSGLVSMYMGTGTNAAKLIRKLGKALNIDLHPTFGDGVSRWIQNLIVVPTENTNSHNYELGQPYLVIDIGDSYFIDSKGIRGNHMTTTLGETRIATPAEIRKFIKELAANNPSTLIALLTESDIYKYLGKEVTDDEQEEESEGDDEGDDDGDDED